MGAPVSFLCYAGEGVDENFRVKSVNSYFHGSAPFDGVGRI